MPLGALHLDGVPIGPGPPTRAFSYVPDMTPIQETVRKTSRVIVAYEDNRTFGYGAEIAARISDELFDELDAPVRRVAAEDCWVAYNPDMEDTILPQSEDLLEAIRDLAGY